METTFVYAPQIPTGTARTRGHGITRRVYVIRCERPDNFKTLNSLTENRVGSWKKWCIGIARFDYGTKKGKSAALMEKAFAFCDMLTPGERSTREEF